MSDKQLYEIVFNFYEAALLSNDRQRLVACAEEIASQFAALGLVDEMQRMKSLIRDHYEILPPVRDDFVMASADVILSILRKAKGAALPPLAWLEMANEHGIETETFLRVVQMLESVGVIYRREAASRVFVFYLNTYVKKSADEDAPLLTAKNLS